MDPETREYLEDTFLEVEELKGFKGEVEERFQRLEERVERLERLLGEGAQFIRDLLEFGGRGEGRPNREERGEVGPPPTGGVEVAGGGELPSPVEGVEELRRQLEIKGRQLEELREELNRCRREKEEIERERLELREGLARLNRELKPVIEELERENRELKEERRLLIARLEGAKEEIAELQQLRGKLEEELERLVRQREELLSRVEELERQLEEEREKQGERLRGIQERLKEWRQLVLPIERLEQLLHQLTPSYREKLFFFKGDKLAKFAAGVKNYPLLWERAFELLKREGANSPNFLTMREILELLFPYYQQIENLEKVVPAKGAPFMPTKMNPSPDSPKEGVVEETQLFGFKKRHSSELLRRPVVKVERV